MKEQLTPEQLREKAGITEQDLLMFMKAWASIRVDMIMGQESNLEACKVISGLVERIRPYVDFPEGTEEMFERIKQRIARMEMLETMSAVTSKFEGQ